MTISVHLSDDMEKRLSHLAQETGRQESFYVQEALRNYLEDLEDQYLAEKALSNIKAGRGRVMSMKEMEASLGLDH